MGSNEFGKVKMARSKGLEPLTPGTGNLCSIQLSYERKRGMKTFQRKRERKDTPTFLETT